MSVKKLLATVAAVGAIAFSGTASALPLYKEFTVTDPATGEFTADKMTGNYSEVVTFGAGTFQFSLLWQLGQFAINDGADVISNLAHNEGDTYEIYATYFGSGTWSTSGGTTTFSLTPGGTLQLWMDNHGGAIGSLTTFSGQTATSITKSNGGDDTKLADGSGVAGVGFLTCSVGTCGTFGQLSSLALTAAGSNYFTAPVPFHELAFTAGQFNAFNVAAGVTQTLNGSMDVWFPVPAPATLALVGLGLVGLGVTRRRSSARG